MLSRGAIAFIFQWQHDVAVHVNITWLWFLPMPLTSTTCVLQSRQHKPQITLKLEFEICIKFEICMAKIDHCVNI